MKLIEKQELKHDVNKLLSDGYSEKEIIVLLSKQGYKPNTIRKYVQIFNTK